MELLGHIGNVSPQHSVACCMEYRANTPPTKPAKDGAPVIPKPLPVITNDMFAKNRTIIRVLKTSHQKRAVATPN